MKNDLDLKFPDFTLKHPFRHLFTRVVLCSVLAVSGVTHANDEIACLRGDFGRTGVFPGTGPDKKPEGWKLLVEQPSTIPFGGFLVHGNRIFIVDSRKLVCTNFRGERLWEADIALPGIRGLIGISRDEVTGELRSSMAYPLHRLLGWGDKVIAVGINGAVKAFALDDGRQLWSCPGREVGMDKQSSWEKFNNVEMNPHPVVHKNCLIFASEREIRRVSLETGKELETFRFLEEGIDQVFFTSQLAASDTALIFSARMEKSDTGGCYAIDLESGKLLWEKMGGGSMDTILVGDRKVIVMGGRYTGKTLGSMKFSAHSILMYDHMMGVELPMKSFETSHEMQPILHQGALFVSNGSEVARMEFEKGRKLWKYRGKNTFGPVLSMGGNVIYATDSTGSVHAINAADGTPIWVCEIKEIVDIKGVSSIPRRLVAMVPSNGALFRLTIRGLQVLGIPVEKEQTPEVDIGMPSDPAAIRKAIEELDRQITEARKEWADCKQLLAETPASGARSDESTKRREAASGRIREITAAAPELKARRAELEKRLK